jgi:tetratricopeptide (TPR) repeat protein
MTKGIEPEHGAFHAGMQATESQALAAETRFGADSTRLLDLAFYLGYACARGGMPAELLPNVVARIRWLIEHHPGSQLMFVVGVYARPTDFAAYDELRAAWLVAITAHGSEVPVLKNAANFFQEWDADRTEALLRRVLELAPADLLSSMALSGKLMQRAQTWTEMHATSGESNSIRFDPLLVAEAIRILEAALASVPETEDTSALLMELTEAAAAANDWQKCELAAQRLLDCVGARDLGWMHGNAVFYGHTGIGRAALRRGDIEESKRRLLAAVAMSGSPQLSSFGPNMSLARELLEVGEREVVLEFFERCRGFWKLHLDLLDSWKDVVLQGDIPDFGANLVY